MQPLPLRLLKKLKAAAAQYDNPVCKGTVTLNGNELFSNFGLGEMTSKIVILSRLDRLQRSV